MRKTLYLACALVALSAPAVQAEGVAVEPGLWEMTTTMTMPMLPQPQTITSTDCIEDAMLDVEEMSGDDTDPNCTFEVSQPDERTVKWTADCPLEDGGASRAEWQVTSGGDSVNGSGTVVIKVMDQEMTMDAAFSGRRVGDCPAD